MSKKITFLTLFLWLTAVTFPVIAQQKADTTYTFRFVPQKDMFYVPWSGNDSELVRLFEFVDSRKSEILEGKMHVYVCGYCNSLENRKENLKTAAIRSNRVKSELIIKKDLTEECFVTHNYVTKGDFVTVRMEVPVVKQETVVEEEHSDLEDNQNMEKPVLVETEDEITEPKISEQKDAEPVQNLESAETPLEPEMRRWMVGLNVGIPFFWGDMLSMSADKAYVGFSAGIQGGYRISEFFAVSLSLDYAKGKLGARSYAQDYLLAPDGMTWYVPQQQTMSRYADLYSDVSLFNLGLSLDVNVNRLFSKSALKHRFHNSKSLSRIVLHDGVKEIGSECFVECLSLRELSTLRDGYEDRQWPENLEKIGEYAFSRSGLVDAKTKLTELPNSVFEQCRNLENASLPDQLEKIGDWAFYATAIPGLYIHDKFKEFGSNVFNGCKNFTNLTCKSLIAPTIQINTFPSEFKTNCILSYPANSDYSSWSSYFNRTVAQGN